MTSILHPTMKGFFTSLGLIISIGPQNSFLLKQGILKNRSFSLALFCSLADGILFTLGVMGVGGALQTHPIWIQAACLGGAIFLFIYGWQSFRSMAKTQTLSLDREPQSIV